MSLYAKVNDKDIVENVIVCEDSSISSLAGKYIKVDESFRTPNSGDSYDSENNKFIRPKPFPSWELNSEFEWVAPDGNVFVLNKIWNESSLEWVTPELNSEE